MTRAAIYCRISDDREGGGLGVARQEADCRALATARGMTVAQVYVDNDLSAYSGKVRPGYLALLEAIAEGEVDAVLAWHTDRLHRSPAELEGYIDACKPGRIPTVTVQAGIMDLATPAGRMVARYLGTAARYESEHKSERAKRKALELAQAGRPSGGLRAFGYEKDRLTVRPDEAAVVVELAGRVLAGESLRSCAADLQRRGISTVTGAAWSPTTVRAMLCRARYAGLREHKGVTYPATWPAVLPLDVHLALRAMMSDAARDTGGRGRTRLLTGIILCGDCRGPMTTHHGGKDRPAASRVSYVCNACQLYGAADGCDVVVIDEVVDRLSHPAFALSGEVDVDDDADEQTIQAGELRLADIGKTWADDPTMDPTVVRALSDGVRARVEAARQRLAERGSRRAAPLPVVVDRSAFLALDLEVQRALVRSVTDSITLARPTQVRRAFDPGRVEVV